MYFTSDYKTFLKNSIVEIDYKKLPFRPLCIYMDRVKNTKIGSELRPNNLITTHDVYINIQTSIQLGPDIWFRGKLGSITGDNDGLDQNVKNALQDIFKLVAKDFGDTEIQMNLCKFYMNNLPDMIVINLGDKNENALVDANISR